MKAIHYLEEKKKTCAELFQWRERWNFASRKIVFTNGVFDIVHAGHIHSLKQAASFGDILVVGLNSDASVKRLKGEERPIQCLEDRVTVLCALEIVDAVVVFEEDTPIDLIRLLRPDVLVKGGDYTIDTIVGAKEVIEHGGRVEIIPLLPGKSTTNLAKRLTEL